MWAGATSMPAVSVGRITSEREDLPSASTSAMDRSTVLRLMPRPAVRFACGSMSTHRTRKPSSASAPARLIAVVVLPTPPFWLAIAITFVTGASPQNLRAGRRPWGRGASGVPSYPCIPWSAHPGYPHALRVVHRICGYPAVLGGPIWTDMMGLSLRKDSPMGAPNGVDERGAVRAARADARSLTGRRRRGQGREATRSRQADGTRTPGLVA